MDTADAADDGASAGPPAMEGCPAGDASGDGTLDVRAITVVGTNGEAPRKGDALRVRMTVFNGAATASNVTLTSYLDSMRFSDFQGVPLRAEPVKVCAGDETSIEIVAGPFLSDGDSQKHFAVGRGAYRISRVAIETETESRSDEDFDGGAFEVGPSNVTFVPVVYDPRYFNLIEDFDGTPKGYLLRSFSRPGEVFSPRSSADPDGEGDFRQSPGGFDDMMNVEHQFLLFDGFRPNASDLAGWCEATAAYAKDALGLAQQWRGEGTQRHHHGFDYLIGLTPDMGGGVACGWLGVQVSSHINRDIDRQQVILVHESGHLFGAPHCDDVGNGSGGALQGYVMCSGEKHAHYPEKFVWHETSFSKMKSRWD